MTHILPLEQAVPSYSHQPDTALLRADFVTVLSLRRLANRLRNWLGWLLIFGLLSPLGAQAQVTLKQLNAPTVGIGLGSGNAFLNVVVKRTVLFGVDSLGGAGRPTVTRYDKTGVLQDGGFDPAYGANTAGKFLYQNQPIEPKMIWYGNKGAFRAGGVYTGTSKPTLGRIPTIPFPYNEPTLNLVDPSLNPQRDYYDTLSFQRFWDNREFTRDASRDLVGDFSFASGANTRASGQFSTAMGYQTQALGHFSTAVGFNSWAVGDQSIVLGNRSAAGYKVANPQNGDLGGNQNGVSAFESNSDPAFAICVGNDSYALGLRSLVLGNNSFAKGPYNVVIGTGSATGGLDYLNGSFKPSAFDPKKDVYAPTGNGSFFDAPRFAYAFGYVARASGDYSMALGNQTRANGENSLSLGYQTIANGKNSLAMGQGAQTNNENAVAIGNQTNAAGNSAFSIGNGSQASGTYATALGYQTRASGLNTMVTGYLSVASGETSTAIGNQAQAIGVSTISLGTSTTATGNFATALGRQTLASGDNATALGRQTIANGENATAIGYLTQASADATAMGTQTSALARFSTAAGYLSRTNGRYSVAMGFDAQTSLTAGAAISMGQSTSAMGNNSIALGNTTLASGPNSVALGNATQATGTNAMALGSRTVASGNNSIALGNTVSTNSKTGALIMGDAFPLPFQNTNDNQMMMRFVGGYVLYTSPQPQGDPSPPYVPSSTAIGVALPPSGNAWTTISDSTRKENFRPADGAAFLKKIGQMRLGSWNYKGQDIRTFRHYGPMAQDFFAAFGHDALGTIGEDKTINQADFDGVNLIAIKALIQEVEQLKAANQQLKADNGQLRTQLETTRQQVEDRLSKLETLLTNQPASPSVNLAQKP